MLSKSENTHGIDRYDSRGSRKKCLQFVNGTEELVFVKESLSSKFPQWKEKMQCLVPDQAG